VIKFRTLCEDVEENVSNGCLGTMAPVELLLGECLVSLVWISFPGCGAS